MTEPRPLGWPRIAGFFIQLTTPMNSFLTFRRALRCLGLLVMLFPLTAWAQTAGTITGTLLDAANNQPLPFTTVVLLQARDSSQVATGTQTAENGTFTLEPVQPGSYLLRTSAVGYGTLRRAVTITAAAPTMRLGTLRLASTTTKLGEVTVTGERAAVVDNLDKKVINVDKDLNSAGGTAVDVLQNVPSVAVDQNGQATLRGADVAIYLDGKPAPSNFRLEQLPASRIENVEVITNPSARYPAAGAGGVINITLKKQQKDGWNGQAAGILGTREKYNLSLSANRKLGKLNFFGSYDANDNHYRGESDLRQAATVEGLTTRTDQNGRSLRHQQYHGGRFGVDYDLTKDQKITVSADLSQSRGSSRENLNTILTRGTDAPLALRNLGYSNEKQHQSVYSVDYRRTWAEHKGRELTANVSLVDVGVDVQVGQRVLDGPASYPRQERRQLYGVGINVLQGQADYVHPLGEKGRLDVGLRNESWWSDGTTDYLLQAGENEAFVRLDNQSFAYRYQQHVQAGYATAQQEFGKWSLQGGLRAEHTTLDGRVLPNTGQFTQRYLNLFPTATLVRTLPGDQRLQLSYSRRLNRPNFMQVLALPIYNDQRNYRIGNPVLRPEFINSVELGHQATWKQTSLTTTLFWRQTTDAIQAIRAIDTAATRLSGQPDFITRTSYQNFGQTNNYGLEMSLNQPLAKWWKITASGSVYRNEVTSFLGDGRNRSTVTGTARLMNSFTPTKQLDVQLTANYRAPQLTAQGRLAAFHGIDVALRQRLFEDRAALTLRVSDIFNTRRNYTQLYSDGLESNFRTKYETRVGYLGFTWFFGNSKPSKKIDQGPQGGGGGFGG
ncbi:TonB-dependent receptor [Hymenobacter sp. NBH84]|nr:TonB-dependent receptor [Hymenobacter sp. NBH84]